MINKYRVHEVAKDFDIKSNIVVDLLTKHFDGQKKHMTALEEDELDLIFDTFTKENEVEDLNDYFNYTPAPKKAKKEEAPAEEKAEKTPVAEVKEEKKPEPEKKAEKKPAPAPEKKEQKHEKKPEQKVEQKAEPKQEKKQTAHDTKPGKLPPMPQKKAAPAPEK